MSNTNKIVIVGGGTAGWMTAATLIRFFPNKDISVIESTDIATVGVGESTLGQINNWFNLLDIEEDDFMKASNSSLKLGIKFTDWTGKDTGGFYYPFGKVWTEGTTMGINDWFIKKSKYPDTPVKDFADCFFPAMSLVHQNKIIKNDENELPGWRYDKDVAYHFDATKFGAWLRDKYCKPRGVNHIVGTIKEDVVVNNKGVEYVELITGEKITADVYIDCTGWKSLLLGKTLKVPFESYSDILPNDTAWATRLSYTDKEKQLEGYTNSTAIENGWVWNIPLWSRIGTGYVFSSQYVSKDVALEEFKNYLKINNPAKVVDSLEYKLINMRIGIHKEIFHKNVCAIGLSAGFIEPLEGNGLFSIHEFLHKLIKTLSRDTIGVIDKLGFSAACRQEFRAFAEFVAIHYSLNTRSDTMYWQDARDRHINVADGEIFRQYGFDRLIWSREVLNQFENHAEGPSIIAVGLNYFPFVESTFKLFQYYHPEKNDFETSFELWENNKTCWDRVADDAPTLYQFLKEKYNE